MAAGIPDVLADPVGVAVALVAGAEPALSRAAVQDVVISVAGGRAKRRKLAAALAERPAVLADGRSPAPRVIGDLLIALRKAGATVISAPACAGCGKDLTAMQRRGQDWYCRACGLRRERCGSCGSTRQVTFRDRDGQPRCRRCPPGDGPDPAAVIAGIVAAIDPAVPAGAVISAVHAVAARSGQRRRLAWALEDEPGLLTGAGARAPTPSVLRLIGMLCDAGASGIVRPPCSGCGRVVHLRRRIGGQWSCSNCVARSRSQPCARCGAIRQAAARDEHGRPLCSQCLIADPANQEACAGCGRCRPVHVRVPGGPLCATCVPWKILTCGICGNDAPCLISKATGKPWCRACKKRWIRCARCGGTGPLRGGTLSEPLCSACTRPDPGFWHSCPDCGQPGRIQPGPCARCAMQQRLRDLLGNQDGEIRPQLQALYHALASTDRPATTAAWLRKSAAPAIIGELAGKDLTHHTLDELPAGKTAEHLRAVLVAIGTLPPRDEQMRRLERWTAQVIAGRPDPGQQQQLHRYAVWHVTRRLRARLGGAHATPNQVTAAQRNIKAAAALLDWLSARDLTLATARQGDLETWLASAQATHRADAGNFVRWARKHKLTSLEFAAIRWSGPAGVIDTEARWEQARRLLHDSALKPEDRVAGLLVLLYAQWPATISQLTLGHIQAAGGQVQIRLGREPVTLPEPLDTLILQLVTTRRGHAVIGDQGTSAWLFPGGQPGRPISAYRMSQRLRQLGIHSGQARSAALFQLATDLPAAVLARMLGIHITIAVTWQRAAAGDWAAYAAEISRRNRPARTPQDPSQPDLQRHSDSSDI
ncbi:MAG TPA: hypothetical protein VLW44_06760 [Streptosporangiaceae bacterium]|nr:hypothetical protein [Streptosporangiaceae bacterium]